MEIYAAILFGLGIFTILLNAAKGNPEKMIAVVISMLFASPLYGRIFGWW